MTGEKSGVVQDTVFVTRDGWFCFVDGKEYGAWRSRNEAIMGMETEQRRLKARAEMSKYWDEKEGKLG